jgi:hypothetical protein
LKQNQHKLELMASALNVVKNPVGNNISQFSQEAMKIE